MNLRSPEARGATKDEQGFTLVELVVAMLIIAIVFTSAAYLMYGSLRALAAAKQRSVFIEIANGELEALRSMPFDELGVLSTDPDFGDAYPAGKHEGREATIVASGGAAAVTTVTASEIEGIILPYTVERWVTWISSTGAPNPFELKRIDVRVTWTESTGASRSFELVSTRYPGDLGVVDDGNTDPVAALSITASGPTTPVTADFDASASSDADGDTLTYTFDFGDGSPTVTQALATFNGKIYSTPGAYTATVTVADVHGDIGIATEQITVLNGGPATTPVPVADFVATPEIDEAPAEISFDATTSSGDNIISYAWDFESDGTFDATGKTVGHTFETAQVYSVTLRVTDQYGRFDDFTDTVEATPLACAVSSGGFFNAGLENEIVVGSTGKPDERTFTFFAKTNNACSTVTATLSLDNGNIFNVTLVPTNVSGDITTWSGSGAVSTSAKFTITCNQSGTVAASGGSANHNLGFTFHVRKESQSC